jgi:predicted transcriptional regulator
LPGLRSVLALLALTALTALASQPAALAVPTLSKQVVVNTNIETKVIVSSEGAIHVLWAVPGLNGSSPAPGIWYSRYNPNGTDSIPPTLIWNSSDVQSADMSIDKFDVPHVVWAEGPAFSNATDAKNRSMAGSRIYYLEVNLTSGVKFTPRALTDKNGMAMWPSIAVDQNLTSHIIWTSLNKQTGRAAAYSGIVTYGGVLNRTVLVAEYNRTMTSIARPGIALDVSSSNVHLAWGETDSLSDGTISTVSYEKLGATGGNLTRLQIARFEGHLLDLSVNNGPNGSAYVVWESTVLGTNGNAVYVSKISRDGKVDFIRQVSQPVSHSTYISLSADSQENLYVVLYQPSLPLAQHTAPANSTLTSVAYVRFDSTGAPSLEGTQLIRGPVIAVTVSESGDILAISNQGVVRVNPTTGEINPLLIGIVVAAIISVFGTMATEEGRYEVLCQVEPLTKLVRRDKSNLVAKYQDVLGVVSRKPGLRAKDIKRFASSTPATLEKLAQLERAGYISSARDGLARRFYSRERQPPTEDNEFPLSVASIPTRILNEIGRNPGIWEAKLSETLNLSQQIVHYHLKKLHGSKLITSMSLEKRILYRLSNSKSRGADKTDAHQSQDE